MYVSYLLDNISIDYNPMPDSREDTCKGITQTLIPNTSAVKPKASQSTDGNLLWSVVYISDTACLCAGAADDTPPARITAATLI
jgi:hypothetical protein